MVGWWTLLVAVALEPQVVSQVPADVVARMEARLAAGHDQGAVIGVLTAEGTEILAFGRRTPTGPPVSATDIFEIGSITKTFTGVLLADAAGRGEVGLDQAARTLLPPRAGRDAGYTLAQLSSHTAGLARMPCNFSPANLADPYADYDQRALLDAVRRCPVERPPGEKLGYSNFGVGLLGEMLATRAGTTWYALVSDRLLRPLDLGAISPAPNGAQVAGSQDGQPRSHWTFAALAGAGALRADAASLLRWGAVHAGLAALPTGPDGDRLAAAMTLATTERFAIGPQQGVGLGWFNRRVGDERYVWHNGGTGGFRSFLGYADDRVVVVLASTQLDVDDVGFHLLDPSLPMLPLPSRDRLSDEALAPYLGQWSLHPGFVLSVTARDGHLVVQATGQAALPVWPDGADRFRWEVVDAALVFTRDASGAISGARLEQTGVHQLKRVE